MFLQKQHQPLLVRGTAQHFSKMIDLSEVLMDEIRIAVRETTCTPDDKKYFQAFFEALSSFSGKSISISLAPRNLKSQIIADAEKPSTTSTTRRNANESREKKNRDDSVRKDHVSKFIFSKDFDEKKASQTCDKNYKRPTNSSHTTSKGMKMWRRSIKFSIFSFQKWNREF